MGKTSKSNLIQIFKLASWPLGVLALTLASYFFDRANVLSPYLGAALALVAVALGGWWRYWECFKDIFKLKITVNVFVSIALTATILIGSFLAAAIIIFIMTLAEAIAMYTFDKSRSGIQKLLDLTPQTALVFRDGVEQSIPISEVQINDIVIVKPGDRIPVDGIVTAGSASVNQAPITGEPIPVMKSVDSELFAGTLNETGRLEFIARKIGEDTTLAKIVHLVEEAQELKAPIQKIVDKFTEWFLPIVLVIAIVGYFVTRDIHSAVSILLVAAPCALVIGTPTAVTSGSINISRRGVLVKGGIYFEIAGKVDALLIDKTGTFTEGRPKVQKIITLSSFTENDVIQMAAIAEKHSEHPLATAILTCAKERSIAVKDPDEFTNEVGLGVTVATDGKTVSVGRPSFIAEKGIALSAELKDLLDEQSKLSLTTVLVSCDNLIIGIIAIADQIRSTTKKAVEALSVVMGKNKIHMLTGDNEASAKSIADQIGIINVHADLLPKDKQEFVHRLQAQGLKVAMIGDGINDAPALASADVGIAMGSCGTDVAIETADVALMNDDLTKVAEFIEISRTVIRRIKTNILFAMIYNIIGVSLGFFGFLNPVIAIILQEAGTITVIISSILLLWATPKSGTRLKT
jgi:heavy metal translocating P-type ATPase